MLQRVQPEVGQLGCFGMAVDGDHAALFVEFIEHASSLSNMRFERVLLSVAAAPRCRSRRSVCPRLPDLHTCLQL